MKKIVIAASLLAAFGAAQADLVLVGGTGQTLVQFGDGDILPPLLPQDYGVVGGAISSEVDSTLTITYLGKEAANLNNFLFNGAVIFDNSATPPLTVVVSEVASEALDFTFKDVTTGSEASAIFAVLGKAGEMGFEPFTGAGGYNFDFVLGFNDDGSTDGDYDDIVIGISAVPEPSTYALMAAGLGAIGFVARRRQRKA